jgi:hypothetical protein
VLDCRDHSKSPPSLPSFTFDLPSQSTPQPGAKIDHEHDDEHENDLRETPPHYSFPSCSFSCSCSLSIAVITAKAHRRCLRSRLICHRNRHPQPGARIDHEHDDEHENDLRREAVN